MPPSVWFMPSAERSAASGPASGFLQERISGRNREPESTQLRTRSEDRTGFPELDQRPGKAHSPPQPLWAAKNLPLLCVKYRTQMNPEANIVLVAMSHSSLARRAHLETSSFPELPSRLRRPPPTESASNPRMISLWGVSDVLIMASSPPRT